MAKSDESQERKQQQHNVQLRTALNDAYAALEGAKYTSTSIAFCFEEAVSLQLQRIEGPGSRIRPSELERVERTEQGLLRAVEQIKSIPPEAFLAKASNRDVNTDDEEE